MRMTLAFSNLDLKSVISIFLRCQEIPFHSEIFQCPILKGKNMEGQGLSECLPFMSIEMPPEVRLYTAVEALMRLVTPLETLATDPNQRYWPL